MKLLEKILVPVKVNQMAHDQLDTAIELSKKFGSKLLLLQVLPSEARTQKVKVLIEEYVDKDFEQITAYVGQNNITVEKIIAYGNMFEKILSTAEEENVNLILIPNDFQLTENNQSVDYLVEKLIRKSEKPVWVVKENSGKIPANVMCPIDYSDSSRRALTNAIKIARIFKAKLYLTNVFEPLEEVYSLRYKVDYDDENTALEKENRNNFNAFINNFSFVDVDYEQVILQGKPHKKIIDFASDKNIDVIFIGATGKTFFQRLLLGSVTELVIRDLPCSVVITKSENILNLKMEKDISDIERLMANAKKLEEAGFYDDSIQQLNLCLKINDLHLPAIYALARIYDKVGDNDLANDYEQKGEEILRRLWDKKIELEIRKTKDYE
ncbi:universal stress protein [Carboxylicivirga sp. RSCT41]|uniref:universal stress protein n=1 Tax=Carboxylicivirga agarovorans TaxID=3417570 RepID=UPI003D3533E6